MQRIEMMGCPIDNLSMEETLQAVEKLIQSGQPHQHMAINVDKIIKAHKDPELRRIIHACALINADGMPVVWAARLLGKPLKQRVTGIDLFDAIMRRSTEKGWRIYLLGATQEVVNTVKQFYENRYPTITIVGHQHGYWLAEEEGDVVKHIQLAQADVLFVATSSPQKEQFLSRYQTKMNIPFAMGIGGTFDVVAGKVKRAPLWMQKSGLEWFYRFLQEPRRMYKRYFIDDMLFFWLLVKEMLR